MMHDNQGNDFQKTMNEMSDAEKLELIEHLAQSLSATSGVTVEQAVAQQRQTFVQLQKKLAAIPATRDPYSDLGYSNAAHDKILYEY